MKVSLFGFNFEFGFHKKGTESSRFMKDLENMKNTNKVEPDKPEVPSNIQQLIAAVRTEKRRTQCNPCLSK